MYVYMFIMMNDWFHCNCKPTVKTLAFLSSFDNKIRYASHFQFEWIIGNILWLRLATITSPLTTRYRCRLLAAGSYIAAKTPKAPTTVATIVAGKNRKRFVAGTICCRERRQFIFARNCNCSRQRSVDEPLRLVHAALATSRWKRRLQTNGHSPSPFPATIHRVRKKRSH